MHPSSDLFALFARNLLYRRVSIVIAVLASDTIPREGDDWSPCSVSGLGSTIKDAFI